MPIDETEEPRLELRGTHTHPATAGEATVFEVVRGAYGNAGTAYITIDVSTLTTNNARLRCYHKVDGTNYRMSRDILTLADDDEMIVLPPQSVAADIKLTLETRQDEGETRAVPYIMVVF